MATFNICSYLVAIVCMALLNLTLLLEHFSRNNIQVL
ncbi:hypothetical protein RBTH_09282 [Bacillus thuringiensis serovar israelensis ATCC 35646]|nr:hypothetical protein RBTH_09282 [Bacillus thuringiensis serovar israelensis ATCC 35646]